MDIKLDNADKPGKRDKPAKMAVRPAWRRTPCSSAPAGAATKLKPKELFKKMNNYFAKCYDAGEHPMLCDVAGDAGFDSVTQLTNHARRQGGETMRGISRAVLAVAAGYEEQAQAGSRHAMTLLGLMPEFDSKEPSDQIPGQSFLPKRQYYVDITGLNRTQDRGKELSPQEAYLQLIKYKTYEEIAGKSLDAEQVEEGDYRVVELGNE